MKNILLIQGIVETIAGICLVLRPDLLFWSADLDSMSYNLSKMYGIIAMSFGLLCLVNYRYSESIQVVKKASLICIGLNLFLSFHLWGLFQSNIITDIAPCIFHIFLGILLFLIYLRNI
jgi:hypothetical protein